jgi:hypothetical protein
MVNAQTHIITTIAGGGNTPEADGIPATSARLFSPSGVAVDAKGLVYFSEVARIRTILTDGTLSTVAGNGYYGFSGDGGSATMASLLTPKQIAFDAGGNLYIPDVNQAVVRKVTFPPPAPSPFFSLAGGTYHSTQNLTDRFPSGRNHPLHLHRQRDHSNEIVARIHVPITINSSGLVEAYASVPGYSDSPDSSKAYTYVPWPPAGAPYFSLAGGSYNTPQSLTLADSTPDETIYYTTNGSTPTTSSTVFSQPITIQSTEVVKAGAIAPNYLLSPVSSKAYTYVTAPLAASPYFSLAGGHYTTPQTLTLSDPTPGAVITTPPTARSPPPPRLATATISVSELVMAIAVAPGYTNSNPSSKAYIIP